MGNASKRQQPNQREKIQIGKGIQWVFNRNSQNSNIGHHQIVNTCIVRLPLSCPTVEMFLHFESQKVVSLIWQFFSKLKADLYT